MGVVIWPRFPDTWVPSRLSAKGADSAQEVPDRALDEEQKPLARESGRVDLGMDASVRGSQE